MRIKVIPKKIFYIQAGEITLGPFHREDEWEGHIKLKDEKGKAIIIVPSPGNLGFIDEIFGDKYDATISTASPDILLELVEGGE